MSLNIPFSSQSYSDAAKVFCTICESGSSLELDVKNDFISPVQSGMSTTSDKERIQYIESLISFSSAQSNESKKCLQSLHRYLDCSQRDDNRFKMLFNRLDVILARNKHFSLKKTGNDSSNVPKKRISFLEHSCYVEFEINSKPSEPVQSAAIIPLYVDNNQAVLKTHQPIGSNIASYSAIEIAGYLAKTLAIFYELTVVINIENIYRCTLIECVDKLKSGDLNFKSVSDFFLHTIFDNMDKWRNKRIEVEGSTLKKLCEEDSPEEWESLLSIDSDELITCIKDDYNKTPSNNLFVFEYGMIDDQSYAFLKQMVQLYFVTDTIEQSKYFIEEISKINDQQAENSNLWFSEGALSQVVMPWLRHQITGSCVEIQKEPAE